MTRDRFTRQRRLAEVGDAGQQRIEAAQIEVRGLDGADIEIRYLAGAGVGELRHDPRLAPEPFVHAPMFENEASRRVAAGAWRALVSLRRALELPESAAPPSALATEES